MGIYSRTFLQVYCKLIEIVYTGNTSITVVYLILGGDYVFKSFARQST